MKRKNYPQGKLPTSLTRAHFNKYVDPYLSHGKRGPKTKVSRYKIFNYILFVLHTGIQWRCLPTFRKEISWSGVYQHHARWSKDDSYKNLFETSVIILFQKNKLDLSILHGDGTNTIAKKGGKVLGTLDTNTKRG